MRATPAFSFFGQRLYKDGELTNVPKNDEKWQNRGLTALLYDDMYG